MWAGLPIPANSILSGSGIRFLGLICPLSTFRCSLFAYFFCSRSTWSLSFKALFYVISIVPSPPSLHASSSAAGIDRLPICRCCLLLAASGGLHALAFFAIVGPWEKLFGLPCVGLVIDLLLQRSAIRVLPISTDAGGWSRRRVGGWMDAFMWNDQISIENRSLHADSATHSTRLPFCGQSSLLTPSKNVSSPVSHPTRPSLPSKTFPFTLSFSARSQWRNSYRLWKTFADDKDLLWPFGYAGEAVNYWPASPHRFSSCDPSTWPSYVLPHSWLNSEYTPEEVIAVILPQLKAMLKLPLLLYPLLWFLNDLGVESLPQLLLRAIAVWFITVYIL